MVAVSACSFAPTLPTGAILPGEIVTPGEGGLQPDTPMPTPPVLGAPQPVPTVEPSPEPTKRPGKPGRG
jgi:hypothetical protein